MYYVHYGLNRKVTLHYQKRRQTCPCLQAYLDNIKILKYHLELQYTHTCIICSVLPFQKTNAFKLFTILYEDLSGFKAKDSTALFTLLLLTVGGGLWWNGWLKEGKGDVSCG